MVEYGFDHLHFKCKDVDAMARFLIDNFGGTLVSANREGPFPRLRLKVGGELLLLNGSTPDEGIAGDMSEVRFGLDHWGLSVNDLDAAYDELKAKGVEFTLPPTKVGNLRIAFLLSPDNVRVELMEYAAT